MNVMSVLAGVAPVIAAPWKVKIKSLKSGAVPFSIRETSENENAYPV